MKKNTTSTETTYVGLDVHKASISVAMFRPGEAKADVWQIANNERDHRRLAKKLRLESDSLVIRHRIEYAVPGILVRSWTAQ
jgi:hypothetical protein